MTPVRIMELALDKWAKNISMHSHEFLARMLGPAFTAAYNRGVLDKARGHVKATNGPKAGFEKIKELTEAIPVKKSNRR